MTLVVKCGGAATLAPDAICADVAALVAAGERVVLVHGGSPDIRALGDRLGVPMRRITAPDGLSGRYTDAAALEVVTLALAGVARPRLVTALLAAGVPAVGLSGLDGGLLRARRRRTQRIAAAGGRQRVVRGDHSGRVVAVHTPLLDRLLDGGYVPVLGPPVLAEDGAPVNADADRAAAAVAGALGADALVLLLDRPGVLAAGSVLTTLDLPADGFRAGGMGVKLAAAETALRAGVPRVLISDARVPTPVRAALAGAGTEAVLAGVAR